MICAFDQKTNDFFLSFRVDPKKKPPPFSPVRLQLRFQGHFLLPWHPLYYCRYLYLHL